MPVTPEKVYCALSTALSNSLSQTRELKGSNSNPLRSALFLSNACCKLNPVVNPECKWKKHHIEVGESFVRKPGEWLLDCVWTEEACLCLRDPRARTIKVRNRIECAFECESSTNGGEFFKDFSKLLVVTSPLKIFAAGLNQTKPYYETYIERRICEIEEILTKTANESKKSDWYVAFWPSPLNKGSNSLWKQLDTDSYSHLNGITLYYRLKGTGSDQFKRFECPVKHDG